MSYQFQHEKAKEYIRQRIENKYNALPLRFPRFSEFLPGLTKQMQVTLMADTGVGKTKFVLKAFVIDLVDYVIANPGVDLRVFYFSLELSSNEMYLNVFSRMLFLKTGKNYPVDYLRGVMNGADGSKVGKEVLDLIDQCEPWLKVFDSKVQFIDYLFQAPAIYTYVEKYLRDPANGTVTLESGNPVEYTELHPTRFTLVITDTINAMHNMSGKSKLETLQWWSAVLCKQRLRNFYKCCVINVQQQDKASNTVQFSSRDGQRVEAKHEPTLNVLSECKTTPDDSSTVVSLFAPHRYKIEQWPLDGGYLVKRLADNVRYLKILKNTHGLADKEVALYFHGGNLSVEELPPSQDIDAIERFCALRGITYRVTAAQHFQTKMLKQPG